MVLNMGGPPWPLCLSGHSKWSLCVSCALGYRMGLVVEVPGSLALPLRLPLPSIHNFCHMTLQPLLRKGRSMCFDFEFDFGFGQ